jgi:hypothetical protein
MIDRLRHTQRRQDQLPDRPRSLALPVGAIPAGVFPAGSAVVTISTCPAITSVRPVGIHESKAGVPEAIWVLGSSLVLIPAAEEDHRGFILSAGHLRTVGGEQKKMVLEGKPSRLTEHSEECDGTSRAVLALGFRSEDLNTLSSIRCHVGLSPPLGSNDNRMNRPVGEAKTNMHISAFDPVEFRKSVQPEN